LETVEPSPQVEVKPKEQEKEKDAIKTDQPKTPFYEYKPLWPIL